MNNDLAGARKIYIDANIIIYFVEGNVAFQDKVMSVFEYADKNDIPLMTSEISVAECLYGAHRFDREELTEKYEWIFRDSDMIHLVPVELGICEAAAKIGARNRFKLIDAIHFASAIGVECDVFITNDKGIKSADSLRVMQISDL